MQNENFKIPLVVGITGHRDIEEKHICSLKEKVEEIYTSLIEKYPETPIVFLSPLADGADRIAAKVAFDYKFKDKITVCTPLPMDEKNYKDTFAKGLSDKSITVEKSIDEYKILMQKINQQENEYIPKTIPMLFDKELYDVLGHIKDDEIDEAFYTEKINKYKNLPNTLEEAKQSKKEAQTLGEFIKQQIRREQYTVVGEYIAIHSNILIAMYDDFSEEKPGGTKEIVRKKCEGSYEHFNTSCEDVTYPEDGIVYSIFVPKDTMSQCKPYEIKRLFPKGVEEIGLNNLKTKSSINILNHFKDWMSQTCLSASQKNYLNIYTQQHSRINCFNKDVDTHIDEIQKKYKKEKLTGNTEEVNLLNKNIMIRRSAAYLANYIYKPAMDRKETILLWLVSITVFLLAVKANLSSLSFNKYLDLIYIVFALVIFLYLIKFNEEKDRQEDFRALAEGLRIQTAWNMVGINSSVALYYLSHQKNELGWIRTAIRGVKIFYLPKEKDSKVDQKRIEKFWITEQKEYFYKKIHPEKSKESGSVLSKEKNLSLKIKITFIVVVVFSILFSVVNMMNLFKNLNVYGFNLTVLDYAQIILVIFPFTYLSYLTSKQLFDGNEELLREYNLSFDIFNRADLLLTDKTNNAKRIYKNLGIEALRENSAWIITRRTKEYSAPSN